METKGSSTDRAGRSIQHRRRVVDGNDLTVEPSPIGGLPFKRRFDVPGSAVVPIGEAAGVADYLARKRLPDDVREEYGRLYGARYDAKFSAPRTTKSHEAQQRYAVWLAEVEGRIARGMLRDPNQTVCPVFEGG